LGISQSIWENIFFFWGIALSIWGEGQFFPPLSPPPLFFSPQCVAGNQNPVAQLDKLDRLFYNVT